MDTPNKPSVVGLIIVGVIILVGIVSLLFLTIHRPDATATFVSQIGTILAIATAAGAQMYSWVKTDKRLKGVELNTNGRLHKLEQERDAAIKVLAQIGLDEFGNPLPTPGTGAVPIQDDAR